MQVRDKRRAIDRAAAARPVAEPDDIGATLPQSAGERQLLGVVGEWHKSDLTIAVIAHQDRQPAAMRKQAGTIVNQPTVTVQKVVERGTGRKVLRIVAIALLSPVGRVQPDKIESSCGIVAFRIAGVETGLKVGRHRIDA
jgi:hypothetical protein